MKTKKALTCYTCEKPLNPSEAFYDEDALGRESFCKECHEVNRKQESTAIPNPKIEMVEAPADATENQKQFVEWLNKFRQTRGSLN